MKLQQKKKCNCKKKPVASKLSGLAIASIVTGSVSLAACVVFGGFILYRHLEKKNRLPWQRKGSVQDEIKTTNARISEVIVETAQVKAEVTQAKSQIVQTNARITALSTNLEAVEQQLEAHVEAQARAAAEVVEAQAQAASTSVAAPSGLAGLVARAVGAANEEAEDSSQSSSFIHVAEGLSSAAAGDATIQQEQA